MAEEEVISKGTKYIGTCVWQLNVRRNEREGAAHVPRLRLPLLLRVLREERLRVPNTLKQRSCGLCVVAVLGQRDRECAAFEGGETRVKAMNF